MESFQAVGGGRDGAVDCFSQVQDGKNLLAAKQISKTCTLGHNMVICEMPRITGANMGMKPRLFCLLGCILIEILAIYWIFFFFWLVIRCKSYTRSLYRVKLSVVIFQQGTSLTGNSRALQQQKLVGAWQLKPKNSISLEC